jgi:uncharacterized protein (TIGR02246 family)
VKRTWIWCFLGLMMFTSIAWSQASNKGGAEQAVTDLEQKWLQASKTNNADLIAPDLADNAIFTTAEGKVRGKAAFLKEERAIKYTNAEYSDVKVTVFGNTAIATGGLKAQGTDGEGKPLDENVRWTDTWVKMPDGKWQCVASQSSPVKV